ncbi:MAG: hypothetical protein E5V92_23995 [Mesorhizobium sp.]|uniref:hypothetical protein n=1 Tax=unclassified Mesorhizobium TaxID=325217 RepID=UPI000F74EF94|nr:MULTISPECIES: hypothetical protein [unclassified Mesorhizobium]AZO73946.1 hypothetical protein EJ067_24525 [Mesorhizobium sp. M1D.F.Ca.ET.043.01.1.1]RWA95283.1 MAG: hypothetical protein EOQ32_06075 [Mesorhizobium sp.]RWE15967.1 MAG: hypothetical protein EOS61_07950 [Mesorhizobium sp.]TJW81691.1 MAG: hypothetical protein E5V92_23995 [Mesorhizobium sp.]
MKSMLISKLTLPIAAANGSRCFPPAPGREAGSGAPFLLPQSHTSGFEAEFPHHIELKIPEVD